MSAPDRHERDDLLLARLLDDVRRARVVVAHCRTTKSGSVRGREYRSWCAELAVAMHAYADAAAASGLPLSYRYRDEMRLYSAIGRERRNQNPAGR